MKFEFIEAKDSFRVVFEFVTDEAPDLVIKVDPKHFNLLSVVDEITNLAKNFNKTPEIRVLSEAQ